ncbi:MAG: SDR family oxidoreductase [Actinobacteria bacterium]|nr:SDR family oxidoreductase [Actinomycetota bacterium]
MQSIDFSGQVVIVTGGTKGIGRTIVERFLELGADVATCGRNEPESLPSVDGRTAMFQACDVRDAAQVQGFVDAVVERFGRLDVLVNNAGGSPHVDAADASPRFSESIIKLNLLAPLYFATAANAVMQNQRGGAIVNVASVSGVRPSPGTAAYGAAKAGLLSLTTSLAVEWAPKVRVNAVTCGLIETEQAELHYGDAAGVARVAATVPLGRMGTPADVANACAVLASPLTAYSSGAQLLVHGGGEKPAFLGAADVN